MALKRTRKLLVWAFSLHAFLVFGQTTFQKTFGGPGNESANWITQAPDGYVMAGFVTNTAGNQDALLVRLDLAGNAVWQKRFGAAQSDAFHCVIPSQDGGFLAVGETKSFGAGNSDIIIVKVDGSGTVLWSKTIGDAEHDDVARCVVGVPGGGFVVSGYSMYTFDTAPSSVFIRLDASGNTVWSRTYSSSVGNLIFSNYIDGNVIYGSGGADADGVFVRIDLNTGAVLSAKAYSGSGSEGLYSQQPTMDGNLVIADHTHSAATGEDIELWVQKIRPESGQVLWSKVYYRAGDNIRGRIERVSDGGFLLVPYDNFNTTKSDALLAKIDANGNLLWSYNYGGQAADRLVKALQTTDGGFIAVGETRSNNANGNSDILIVKTDANGRIQGTCAMSAGIQTADFVAENKFAETSESNWLSSTSLNTVPLPINLGGQNYSPSLSPTIFKNIPLCPNSSITIGGKSYFAPKMVSDTVSNLNGCDSIFNYNLTLTQFNSGIHVIGLCEGETFNVDGVQYTAPATVVDTVAALMGGCDTLCTFVLKVWSQPMAAQTITFCQGSAVVLGGHTYTQPGVYQVNIPSATTGCDTLVTYTLIERPLPTRATTISFCPGESVMIDGNTYSQAGTVVSKIPSTAPNACDTMVTYTLVLRPQPTRSTTISFCPGESVIIGGNTYSQSGVVQSTVPANNGGCDTLVTYTLDLRPQPTKAITKAFCPGETVTIDGQVYSQSATVVSKVAATNGGCDTIVTYTLDLRPQPTRAETRWFCPGESVILAGQAYNQAGVYLANLPAIGSGCDTIVTYTLIIRPQPTRAETRGFCPGEIVTLGGQNYSQPGSVVVNLTSKDGGCDTIVTYTLELRPQPTLAETRSFCPGESVLIAGHNYDQPGIITVNVPATTGCDTVVTYTLQHLTPAPSNIAVHCPKNISVVTASGSGMATINYAEPLAASDCICPGLQVTRTSGLPSGSLFPMGNTQVCYTVKDNCGQEKPCCFAVELREEAPCDVKENGCMKYELLSITADAGKNHTYRIRVTNTCANKLSYTAIELPDGIVAMDPVNNSTYSSPLERNYVVRSPNFTPMYSIRFKSTTDSIANGQSDIFEYTLPAQAKVSYINITSRLSSQVFYEAHLNTFNCPVGITPSNSRSHVKLRDAESGDAQNSMLLFPNPTTGVLFADLSDWQGQKLQINVTNTQGQVVHSLNLLANDDLLRVEMPQGATSGIYFMEVSSEKGEKEMMRFMLQR